MRQLIIIFSLLSSTLMYTQVAIGKSTVSGADTILDFGTDNNKGIILPWVGSLVNNSVAGTLYFDTIDSKVKCITDSGILDLSIKGTEIPFDASRNDYGKFTENSGTINGGVFGEESSTTPGILVLESGNDNPKAMVLPKVSSYSNVGAPEPGTIVYDSTAKMLCVYDGEQWAFWGE